MSRTMRLAELGSDVVTLQLLPSKPPNARRAKHHRDGLEDVQSNPAVFAPGADLSRQHGRLTELQSRLVDRCRMGIEAQLSGLVIDADLRGAGVGRLLGFRVMGAHGPGPRRSHPAWWSTASEREGGC